MPKFEVVLIHTTRHVGTFVFDASDEDSAADAADVIAQKVYKDGRSAVPGADWELSDEDCEVESVYEVED
jgi:hypothetical protein